MGTTLNKEDRLALIKFLSIYMISAVVLIAIIAVLYYKKEIVAIEEKCTMEMVNSALQVEKELMNAHMEGSKYNFIPPKTNLNIGLFTQEGKSVYSNLESPNVKFDKVAYKSDTHEFHIDTLDMSIFGIKYIVVEGQEGFSAKYRLIALIASVVFVSTIFIGIIGYFLSRILVAPMQERVEKLNAFIKDTAHDINTPVSALMMSVSSLKNRDKIDTRVLNHISISTKLISQIYNSLSFIAFNDRDEILNEEFDIKELIEESVKFFDEVAAAKGNTIQTDMQSTLAFMDRSRTQKLINNLISNAIKYSYPNTPIVIKLKDRVFSIKDEGIGISKEDQKSIFNRYERKSKESGGFGIGLDIVRSVCTTYNIKIWIKSILQKETTFYLKFPKYSN